VGDDHDVAVGNLVDEFGATPDPFGTAPGPTSLGPSPNPNFDYEFTADLSSLTGAPITISLGPHAAGDASVAFDVSNQDDGKSSSLTLTGMITKELNPPKRTPDQGPTSFLFLISLFTILAFDFLQRGRTCQ
jgi:hypothetical protein